jgi:hypothetical protein
MSTRCVPREYSKTEPSSAQSNQYPETLPARLCLHLAPECAPADSLRTPCMRTPCMRTPCIRRPCMRTRMHGRACMRTLLAKHIGTNPSVPGRSRPVRALTAMRVCAAVASGAVRCGAQHDVCLVEWAGLDEHDRAADDLRRAGDGVDLNSQPSHSSKQNAAPHGYAAACQLRGVHAPHGVRRDLRARSGH